MQANLLKSVIFVCLILGISGCSDSKVDNAERAHASMHKYKFEKDVFPPYITGTVRVNNSVYEMERGNFQWKKGNSHVQTDAAGPMQIAENFQAIVLEPSSILTIEIEQTPDLSAILWSSNEEEVFVNNNQLTVPSEKGKYVYEILSKWSNGEVSFTFVVEVK